MECPLVFEVRYAKAAHFLPRQGYDDSCERAQGRERKQSKYDVARRWRIESEASGPLRSDDEANRQPREENRTDLLGQHPRHQQNAEFGRQIIRPHFAQFPQIGLGVSRRGGAENEGDQKATSGIATAVMTRKPKHHRIDHQKPDEVGRPARPRRRLDRNHVEDRGIPGSA
jgi:hypothetical protein